VESSGCGVWQWTRQLIGIFIAISENLGLLTNEIQGGQWNKYFACGQSACWGVQQTESRVHRFRNDAVPKDFIDVTNTLDEKGSNPIWKVLDFVAFGVGDVWVFAVDGKAVWSERLGEVYPELLELLKEAVSEKGKVVRRVKNIALSPVQENIFWIEYQDCGRRYHVPEEWRRQVHEYTRFWYRLYGRKGYLEFEPGEVGMSTAVPGVLWGVVAVAKITSDLACCCAIM